MDEDLGASLAGLAGLLTDPRPLPETLVQIAELAVRAIPAAEGAGLTMLDDDRPQTVVAARSSCTPSTTCSTAHAKDAAVGGRGGPPRPRAHRPGSDADQADPS